MNAPTNQTRELRPVDHASTAAEAIRALNHATLWNDTGEGYAWPADVDATVAALEQLVERLPQALTQAAFWLRRAHAVGAVGHDTSQDDVATALEAVNTVDVLLRFAASRAQTLAKDLSGIHQETAHLTGLSELRGTKS